MIAIHGVIASGGASVDPAGSIPADFALDFTGVTAGSLLTNAILTAAKVGGSGFTFSFEFGVSHAGGGLMDHTTVETDGASPSYDDPFTIGATTYDASETKIIQVDMSGRAGADSKWEKANAVIPDGTSGQFCVRALMQFPVAGGTSQANIDHLLLNGGDFCVMQQQIIANDTTTRGQVNAHSGGGNGPQYPVSSGWKIIDIFGDSDGLKGNVMVRDKTTGDLELVSQSTLSDGAGFSFVGFASDYLTPFKGTTKLKGLVFAFGAKAAFPLGSYTQAPPDNLSVSQSGPLELTLTFDALGLALSWTIRRRVNGGSWSVVSTDQTTASYVDSDVSVDDIVEYGVTATTGSHVSSEAVSDPFTVEGGGSGIALVVHASGGSTVNGATTGAITTTGANLIIIAISDYTNVSASTPTDSKIGNTWIPLTEQTNGPATNRVNLFYCIPISVGSGHTFTVSNSGAFPAFEVAAFSGANAIPFGSENGASFTSVASAQPGSITPAVNGSLIILAAGFSNASDVPTATGYITSDYDAIASGFGGVLMYRVQGTAGAENPTMDFAATDSGAMKIACFKPA